MNNAGNLTTADVLIKMYELENKLFELQDKSYLEEYKLTEEDIPITMNQQRLLTGVAMNIAKAVISNGGAMVECVKVIKYLQVCIHARYDELNIHKAYDDLNIKHLKEKYMTGHWQEN